MILNQNNSIFIGFISDFGDEYDVASAVITAIISVPIFTFLILSILGISDSTPTSIWDLAFLILVDIVLGNIDKVFCEFLAGSQKYIMLFLGFAIVSGINFMNIFRDGMAGVILSVLTVLAAFIISVPSDIYINRRPG